MLFSLATTTSLLTLLAAHAYANPVQIEHRDTVFPTTIAAPTAGTTISPGDSFNFSYTPADYCFEAYSPLTVWLLASSPTAADLNSTMGFSEYLFYFGQYTAADDPVHDPPFDDNPPATLSAPDLGASAPSDVYFAVVESITGCPPNGQVEYALASTPLTYSA